LSSLASRSAYFDHLSYGATTIATIITMTGRKARRPGNFIATDQISVKDKYTFDIRI
jgi:hypothetical protein